MFVFCLFCFLIPCRPWDRGEVIVKEVGCGMDGLRGGSWDLACVAAWLVISLSGPRRKDNRHKEVAKASIRTRHGSEVISLFVGITRLDHFAACLRREVKPASWSQAERPTAMPTPLLLLGPDPSISSDLCSPIAQLPVRLPPPAVQMGLGHTLCLAPPLHHKDNVRPEQSCLARGLTPLAERS